MAESARVHSIDAIRDFRAALITFGERATAALDEAETDLRRFMDWLEHEQQYYWEREIKRRWEEVNQAKSDMARKRISAPDDRPPDLTEQKDNLRTAQRRLEEAQEKLEAVRRWTKLAQQAILEYEGPARILAGQLETDIPESAALLERMLDALDSYVAMTSPANELLEESGASREDESMARPAGEVKAEAIEQSAPEDSSKADNRENSP